MKAIISSGQSHTYINSSRNEPDLNMYHNNTKNSHRRNIQGGSGSLQLVASVSNQEGGGNSSNAHRKRAEILNNSEIMR